MAIIDIHTLIIRENQDQNIIPMVLVWKHDSAHSFTVSILLLYMN